MDIRKILQAFRRLKLHHGFIFCWICGLLLGTILAVNTDPSHFALFRFAPNAQLSAPGILVAVGLPFAVAIVLAALRPGWLILLGGIRAFAFAYTAMAIHIVFSTAGWLLCFLLQFGGIFSLPLICWFCLRRLIGKREAMKTDVLILCGFTVAIAAVDLYFIAPLLQAAAAF